jgi:hypothetical protein
MKRHRQMVIDDRLLPNPVQRGHGKILATSR